MIIWGGSPEPKGPPTYRSQDVHNVQATFGDTDFDTNITMNGISLPYGAVPGWERADGRIRLHSSARDYVDYYSSFDYRLVPWSNSDLDRARLRKRRLKIAALLGSIALAAAGVFMNSSEDIPADLHPSSSDHADPLMEE